MQTVNKLRLLAHQVTPRRPSSYVSIVLKWDFRCVKPMFSLSQNYAFTQSKLCIHIVKTTFLPRDSYVFTPSKHSFLPFADCQNDTPIVKKLCRKNQEIGRKNPKIMQATCRQNVCKPRKSCRQHVCKFFVTQCITMN